ncbi:MAG TPA: sugar-binding transcriptional regulator [Anaerolineaceae bacterium]
MPRLLPNEELRLLSKVSKLYYDEGMTQDEIVEKLQLSRSKISRLLRQAREEGVVQISVVSPPGVFPELELQLERRYGLQEVIVVDVRQPDNQAAVTRDLGNAAAGFLRRVVRSGDVIGISWGNTMRCMVDAMHFYPVPNSQVVQIIGGLGRPESEVHATELCRRLARSLNSRLVLLPAPGIVDSQQIKEIMLSDSHVQSALNMFARLTLALVGIGSPAPGALMMHDGSIVTPEEMEGLVQKGAVGDIALRFFDIQGRAVHSNVDDRVIGITLDELSQVERVVGVAGGPEKDSVLLGALQGKLINTLITDAAAAQRLLEAGPVP